MMKAIFFEHLPYLGTYYVGSHQFARRFIKDGWKIFWISHPISPLHFIYPRKKDFSIRYKAWLKGPEKFEKANLLYYSPLTILPSTNFPLLNSKFIALNSINLTIPNLKNILKKYYFLEPDLIWLTNPIFAPFVKNIRANKIAYRFADDLTSYRQVSKNYQELENLGFKISNKVFVVSKYLLKKVQKRTDNAVFLSNGADFELFQKAREEPQDLKNISRPRIIYIGVTEDTFDANLVYKCASNRHNYSFIFIGNISKKLKYLNTLGNVYLLDKKPHDKIPGYLKFSDVAIIPFRRIPLVETLNPVKLYEYLSVGLPVVTTKWNEIEEINPPVYLANRKKFCHYLDIAVKNKDKNVKERIDFARNNSWGERYKFIKKELKLT